MEAGRDWEDCRHGHALMWKHQGSDSPSIAFGEHSFPDGLELWRRTQSWMSLRVSSELADMAEELRAGAPGKGTGGAAAP